jgi:transcriptional regulator with XRE-family HTH domain
MLDRLAELRKGKNWSLQETADQLGIAKSTYAGYESGYREPSLKALSQIADLFDTTTDYILDRVNSVSPLLELAEYLKSDNKPIELLLDGISISEGEIVDFIAFTRLKRNFNHEYTKKGGTLSHRTFIKKIKPAPKETGCCIKKKGKSKFVN